MGCFRGPNATQSRKATDWLTAEAWGRGKALVIGELREIGRPQLWNANRSEAAGLAGYISTEGCYRFLPATGGNPTDWLTNIGLQIFS